MYKRSAAIHSARIGKASFHVSEQLSCKEFLNFIDKSQYCILSINNIKKKLII